MSAKHRDPEFRKNARIVRQGVQRAHRIGRSVTCWRCGHDIEPGQSFDVGHIDASGGASMSNLAPEHRYRSGYCQGNRAAGGRVGAAITNRDRRVSSGLLPW